MADGIPLRRWLPLSDAVAQISECLGLPTKGARGALLDALKDEITGARGYCWDDSNDRKYLQIINMQILLNSSIDWDKATIIFNESMLLLPDSDLIFHYAVNVEVHRESLDEWLEAHRGGEPSASDHKSADVVREEGGATKPVSPRRGKGGPRPKPYRRHLHKFLSEVLDREGEGYFDIKDKRLGAIESDVRKRFKIDDPENRRGLPKTRSGLQEPIKKWIEKNISLD
jgi:hypothetical protein